MTTIRHTYEECVEHVHVGEYRLQASDGKYYCRKCDNERRIK